MDGMDAGVLDTPVEEIEDGLGEVEEGAEAEVAAEPVEGETQETESDNPYTTKFGRDYRQYLNSLKQTNPEAAKFVKQARDDYGRAFALQQLDPKGIDGIRENYALLQAIGGGEGLTGLQERIAQAEEVDTLLASGDPRALETLGEDFNPGLAKLAPAILERVAQSNPEAYQAAILPHVVSALTSSPVIAGFNAMVDTLNQAPPSWLTSDQKTQWAAERLKQVMGHVAQMSDAFNSMGQKAGEFKAAPQDKARTEFETERQKFEQEKQESHWNTNIKPQAAQYENSKFEELYKAHNLQSRLKLDAAAKDDLKQAYKAALNRAGSQDQDYLRQMKIYRGQKNPDPAQVTNFVKNAINKHSKTAMESLVKARYGSFLAGKPKTAVAKPGTKPTGPVEPNVEIRTVKPPMNEIDHRNTPIAWLAEKKYRLYSGKVIQVRQA